jgi:IS30 family transposase
MVKKKKVSSQSKLIKYKGKTNSIRGWAREIGINESTIRRRLKRNVPVARALQKTLV